MPLFFVFLQVFLPFESFTTFFAFEWVFEFQKKTCPSFLYVYWATAVHIA